MLKNYLLLIGFFCTSMIFAQDSYTIQGQVLDINTQLPLESANVFFAVVRDSLKLGATTTDAKGLFRIRLKKYENPVTLNVSYVGHENYKDELAEIGENKDFGTIYLFATENKLDEIVIKASVPQMVVKQDTLEYNAASFKVRPDENVEAVFKELPGFVMDDNGKITVNGKEVSQILVNGKAFFGKDGLIALQNLPADIINKIQVSDFKTKEEELAGEDAASDFLSINLTIDEKKNKGYFGKFLGGYGSDDRYEGSFLVNQFDKRQRISAVGSTNNINLSGFSIDEAFGDGDKSKSNSDIGPVISRKGITQTNLAGLNYFNEWSEKLETTGDYAFNNSVNKNTKKSTLVRFLPTGDIKTESDSDARIENNNHKLSFEMNYKPSKTIEIAIEPRLRKTNYSNEGSSTSSSTNANGGFLNTNNGVSARTSEGVNFDNQLTINKNFEKKSRNMSFSLVNNNADNKNEAFNKSTTTFLNNRTVVRNQMDDNSIKRDYYFLGMEYTEPITSSIRLKVGVDYRRDTKVTDEKTFNFDQTTQLFSTLNEAQSSYVSSVQNAIAPKIGLFYKDKAFSFYVRNNSYFVNYDNYSLYLKKDTSLKNDYYIPEWHSQMKYKVDKSNYALLKYDYKVNLPTAYQLLPVIDISSTVNTVQGNPDLAPIKKHSFNFNFRNYNVKKRSGYNLFVKTDILDSDIITARRFAEDGTSNTSFENISDTYKSSLGANWNNYIKKNDNSYRFGLGFKTDYTFDKGFVNNLLYDVHILSFTPKAYFTYNYGELFTISPSYNFVYDESKYKNYSIDSRSNVIHRANLKTTNYFGQKWVLGNDFGYSYNTLSGGTYQNEFYLWNMSMSYTFLEKTLTARVKAYDILNQNQGYSRSITDTSIRDEENTVLKRYVLFSLIYKIKNFGGLSSPPESKREKKG